MSSPWSVSPTLPGATYERTAARLAGALSGVPAAKATAMPIPVAPDADPAPAEFEPCASSPSEDVSATLERPEPMDHTADGAAVTEHQAGRVALSGTADEPAGDRQVCDERELTEPEPAGADVSCLVVEIEPAGRGPAWVRTHGRDSRLGQWAVAHPHGIWWDAGLWTDRFVLPAGEPVAAGARTMSSPAQAAAGWAQLRGQRHGNLAWVIALAADGSVLCQWVAARPQIEALLSDLVAPGYPWPGDDEWYLDREASQSEPVGESCLVAGGNPLDKEAVAHKTALENRDEPDSRSSASDTRAASYPHEW